MKRQQSGFSLTETVTVTVLLGLLAATVLPKFGDMTATTLKTSVKALKSAMHSANSNIYLAAAEDGVSGTTYMADGTSVSVVYRFASDATELAKVLDLDKDIFVVGSNAIYVTSSMVSNTTKCRVTYTPPSTSGAWPSYTLADPFDCS